MNYQKKTVRDIDVKGKKVLLRCDFNVPQDKKTGAITSDKRIVAALPTIRYLLDQGAAVIACSHLGKPQPDFDKWVKKQTEKGKDPATLTEDAWSKEQKKLTLAPVAARLAELLGQEVIFASDVVGEDAQAKAAALQPGQVLLLENTRFEKGETKNDPAFAQKLASMAEVYVSDAFGAVHRAHASTAGVAAYLPAVSGFLIEKELEVIGGALANPKRPLVAILGGSKVSSKIGVINNLLEIADTIIIGGGMAYTFSAAQGGQVGDSLLEADWEAYSLEMLEKAKVKGVKLLLPVDTVIADAFSPDANSKVVKSGEIPAGWQGLDIGPETVKLYCDAVADAGTVIWNGPMGVFEFPAFAEGTRAVAQALAETVACYGDDFTRSTVVDVYDMACIYTDEAPRPALSVSGRVPPAAGLPAALAAGVASARPGHGALAARRCLHRGGHGGSGSCLRQDLRPVRPAGRRGGPPGVSGRPAAGLCPEGPVPGLPRNVPGCRPVATPHAGTCGLDFPGGLA